MLRNVLENEGEMARHDDTAAMPADRGSCQAVGKGAFCGTAAIASYARWRALPGFPCGPGLEVLGR